MAEVEKQVLLIHQDAPWVDELCALLEMRGWYTQSELDTREIYSETRYQVYLFDLSHPALDVRAACDHVRALPRGESSSIFLLNDGSSPLKSFESTLDVGADGLYFHHTQLSLLLTNFPSRLESQNSLGHQENHEHQAAHSDASRGQRPSHEQSTHHPTIHNRERVLGLSLGHRNRRHISASYHGELSVADIEAALGRSPTPEHQTLHRGISEERSYAQSPHHPSQRGRPHVNAQHTMMNLDAALSPIPNGSSARSQSLQDSPIPSSVSNSVPNSVPNSASARVLTSPQSHQHNAGATPRVYTPPMSPMSSHLTAELETNAGSSNHTPARGTPLDVERIKLDVTSFAEIFASLINQRRSQHIVLHEAMASERIMRWWSLSIFEGKIVGVNATHLVEQLIHHLIAGNLISKREAELALSESIGDLRATYIDRAEQHFNDFIEALFELKPQLARPLAVAIDETKLRVVHQLFELTDGEARLSEFTRPDEPTKFKLSSTRILIDGIQQGYGRLKLYSVFGTFKAVPLIKTQSVRRDPLSEAERLFLRDARGEVTIAELADRSPLTALEALGLCYALSLLGELQLVDKSALKAYYQRAQREDYFKLLSLSYDVSGDEIVEAWQTHRAWLSEQRGDPELVQSLTEILNDAYCVLAHSTLRTRYLSSLSKPVYSEQSIVPQSQYLD